MPDSPSGINERVTRLESNMSSMAKAVEAVATDVKANATEARAASDKLATAMAALQDGVNKKFQQPLLPIAGFALAAVGLVVTIMSAIGSSWMAPVQVQLGRLDHDMQTVTQNYVPKWVHEKFWDEQALRFDKQRGLIDALEARTEKRLDRIEGKLDAKGATR